jgi:hypothetical protein
MSDDDFSCHKGASKSLSHDSHLQHTNGATTVLEGVYSPWATAYMGTAVMGLILARSHLFLVFIREGGPMSAMLYIMMHPVTIWISLPRAVLWAFLFVFLE